MYQTYNRVRERERERSQGAVLSDHLVYSEQIFLPLIKNCSGKRSFSVFFVQFFNREFQLYGSKFSNSKTRLGRSEAKEYFWRVGKGKSFTMKKLLSPEDNFCRKLKNIKFLYVVFNQHRFCEHIVDSIAEFCFQ